MSAIGRQKIIFPLNTSCDFYDKNNNLVLSSKKKSIGTLGESKISEGPLSLELNGPFSKKTIQIPEGFMVEAIFGIKEVSEKNSPMNFQKVYDKEFLGIKLLPTESEKSLKEKRKKPSPLWGTLHRKIQQELKAVSLGHEVNISLRGIGYKAFLKNDSQLQLKLGKAHDLFMELPKSIKAYIGNDPNPLTGGGENQYIQLKSDSLNEVTSFADKIKKLRPPEPYKSKGILIRNPRNDALIKALAKPPKGAKSR